MQQYVKVIAILSLLRAGLASAQLPDEDNRLEYDPSKGEECIRGWFEEKSEYTQPWSSWDGKGDWGTLRPVSDSPPTINDPKKTADRLDLQLDQRSSNMTDLLNCAAECLAAADQFPQRKYHPQRNPSTTSARMTNQIWYVVISDQQAKAKTVRLYHSQDSTVRKQEIAHSMRPTRAKSPRTSSTRRTTL